MKKPAPGVAKCSPNGGCTFEITISNPTAVEVPGPITIDDTLFEAPNAARTGDPSAPWECTKTAPFSCKHPGPLAANGSLTLMLSFAPNTPPAKKEIKNCAAIHTEPPPATQTPPPAEVIPPAAPGGTGPLLDPNAPMPLKQMHLGGPDECLAWKLPTKFSIIQANGIPVTFEVIVDGDGKVSGTAYYYIDPDFLRVDGQVVGTYDGNAFRVHVSWPDETVAKYEGRYDNGEFVGFTRDLRHGSDINFNVLFRGKTPFECAKTGFCDDYAKTAAAAALDYKMLKCGSIENRWQLGYDYHLDVCMFLSRTGNKAQAQSEADERGRILDKCKIIKEPLVAKPGDRVSDIIDRLSPLSGGQGLKDAAAAPEQCATIPLDPDMPAPEPPQAQTGPLTIEKTRTVETCTETGVCSFAIVVTNTSDQPSGKITVEDIARLDNGAVPTALSDDPKPWTCISGPGSITCDLPSIAAKSKSPPLPASFRPDKGSKQIDNCATIQGTTNKACATMPVTEPPQTGPLTIAKKGTVTSCTNDGGCSFQVDVTNTSTTAFTGPIEVLDRVTVNGVIFGTMTLEKGPTNPWSCQGSVQSLVCIHPNTETLAPGSSVKPPLTLSFKIGSGKEQPNIIKNCATLRATDNLACAELPVVEPATAPIILLPNTPADVVARPNLKITKIATAGACPVAGPCPFEIAVKNEGAADFTGKLAVLDQIGSVSAVSSIEVLPKGVGLPVDCKPGKGEPAKQTACTFFDESPLMPGETRALNVNVFPGEEWQKDNVLKNCASLFKVSGDTKNNDPVLTHEQVCAEITLDPFNVKMAKAGDQSCQPGGECHFDLEALQPRADRPRCTRDDHRRADRDRLGGDPLGQPAAALRRAAQAGSVLLHLPRQSSLEGWRRGALRRHPSPSRSAHERLVRQLRERDLRRPGREADLTRAGCCVQDGSDWARGWRRRLPVEVTRRGQARDREKGDRRELHRCRRRLHVRHRRPATPAPGRSPVRSKSKRRSRPTARSPRPPTCGRDANAPWACSKAAPAKFACRHPGPLDPGKEARLQVNFGLRADTGAKEIENCAALKGSAEQACAKISARRPGGYAPASGVSWRHGANEGRALRLSTRHDLAAPGVRGRHLRRRH